ncbi:MAG: alpha-1,2-fucosyltransferase [Phycisphaerae bacterium]|nr:alpha-1,2-fucosyltransferase [Phycisphaerae bacterium]
MRPAPIAIPSPDTRVVVRLSGGLGNQLFQYAAGRSLAIATNATLALDRSSFQADRLRRFALGRFPLAATLDDLVGWRRRVVDLPGIWRLARTVRAWPRVGRTTFLFDAMRGFDPRWNSLVGGVGRVHVLTGYWQDEGFLAAAEADLARECDPSSAFPRATIDLGTAFQSETTLGIHLRRGDFAETRSPHRVCTIDYYRSAIAEAIRLASPSRVVVFSDDPAWAASVDLGLPSTLPRETMPRDASRGDDEDLWLLGRCRALVLSNSSYSWWGARLAELAFGEDRVSVICPNRWYHSSAGPIPSPARSRWVQVAV